MHRRPHGISRIEVVQNQGMQDPKLEVGRWAFVVPSEDNELTSLEVPTTDDFNSVEAGQTDFYTYTQPTDQD